MTEYQYIIDSTGLKDRYDRICLIIAGLETQQLAVIANSDIEEYTLDDGQTKIKTVYRDLESITKAILDFTKIKNQILQQLTGTRIVRLADAKAIQSNKFLNI